MAVRIIRLYSTHTEYLALIYSVYVLWRTVRTNKSYEYHDCAQIRLRTRFKHGPILIECYWMTGTNDKINQTWSVWRDQISRLKQKKRKKKFANSAWEACKASPLTASEERWSLSLPHHTRLPVASFDWLSLCTSYSISAFSRPSLQGSSTGLLTHVSMHGKRLFPCYSSRFWPTCLVFGNRISRSFACNI